jgi:hypothetical protein
MSRCVKKYEKKESNRPQNANVGSPRSVDEEKEFEQEIAARASPATQYRRRFVVTKYTKIAKRRRRDPSLFCSAKPRCPRHCVIVAVQLASHNQNNVRRRIVSSGNHSIYSKSSRPAAIDTHASANVTTPSFRCYGLKYSPMIHFPSYEMDSGVFFLSRLARLGEKQKLQIVKLVKRSVSSKQPVHF